MRHPSCNHETLDKDCQNPQHIRSRHDGKALPVSLLPFRHLGVGSGHLGVRYCSYIGHIGRKRPTRSVPHGIGGAATSHIARIVVVHIAIVVDIDEIGGVAGKIQKTPLTYNPSVLLSFFSVTIDPNLLLDLRQPFSNFTSNSIMLT